MFDEDIDVDAITAPPHHQREGLSSFDATHLSAKHIATENKSYDAMPSKVKPFIMKNSRKAADCSGVGNGGRIRAKMPRKTLTRLVARRNWPELEHILSSPILVDWINIDEKGVITEESILQFALRYGAPLHVVELLALRYPKCLTKPDSTGKFSSHVAAKYAAPPDVMDFLVRKNPYAAGVQDPSGKCPIHYAAEFYICNSESDSEGTAKEHMLQVVRILREAAPQSFNIEDDEGCNAIEYAIYNDVDIKIIKTMQRAARDDWRALRKSGQGKKHEDLAKDVERSASEARTNVALVDVVGSTVRRDDAPAKPFKSFVAKSA